MKVIKIIFFISIFIGISCNSIHDKNYNTLDTENPAVKSKTAGITEETVTIYGLIKVDSGNVYIVTNWKSRSMVTYTVTGEKKPELEANTGKYACVTGILSGKQTWSGTIDVKTITSIDTSPDPQKERLYNSMKKYQENNIP